MPLVRRRPLLRAAALGGTYMMGQRRANLDAERQNQAYYEGQQAAMATAPPASSAPPRPAGITSADTARLEELGKLHEQGILTDEEFAKQKSVILGGA